jgi:hypothetical protein
MAIEHLKALDYASAGHWDAAHELVQTRADPLSCRIHGYLHRVEGDHGNAGYWYARAGEEMPANSLDEELARLYALAAQA